MLETKSALTEIKNAFHGLIRRLDTAKETTTEPEDRSTETSQTENQRGKKRIETNKETKHLEHPIMVGEF